MYFSNLCPEDFSLIPLIATEDILCVFREGQSGVFGGKYPCIKRKMPQAASCDVFLKRRGKMKKILNHCTYIIKLNCEEKKRVNFKKVLSLHKSLYFFKFVDG